MRTLPASKRPTLRGGIGAAKLALTRPPDVNGVNPGSAGLSARILAYLTGSGVWL